MAPSSTSEQLPEIPQHSQLNGYITDSYVFNWKNQTFVRTSCLFRLSPSVLAWGYCSIILLPE